VSVLLLCLPFCCPKHVSLYLNKASVNAGKFSRTLSMAYITPMVSPFLGTFAEFLKATVSFVISVCRRSVCMEQLGLHWKDFHEIRRFFFFGNLLRKFQIHNNMAKIIGAFRKYLRGIYIYCNISSVLLIIRNIWEESCREIQTQIVYWLFFWKSCLSWIVRKYGTARLVTWQYSTAYALFMLDS
jgi:hypothetical protein